MKKIKIAIVGATGTIYKRTLPALINSNVCEVVAVQGRNIDKLRKIQEEFHIKDIYLDEEKMLAEAEFDCIYIGTPPFMHKDNLAIASATSKPIICEKPLAINYEKGVEISKMLGSYDDATFMIAHHLRHQQAVIDIKNFIAERVIGDILNVSMQWGFEMNLNAPSAIWKTNPEMGGLGTFSDNGIHIVDLSILLFGLPDLLCGNVSRVRTGQTFDNETALLKKGKLTVQLQSSQTMKHPGNHILIYGTDGSIEAFNGIGEKYIKSIIVKSPSITKTIDYPETNLYGNEVENFCKKLLGQVDSHNGTTLKDGLDALKIIDSTRIAAQANKTIKMNYEQAHE